MLNTVAGRNGRSYHIVKKLNQVGDLSTFLAHHISSDSFVTLTYFPDRLGEEPSFLEEFHRYIQQIAALDHPFIVPIIDYGFVGNRPYVARPFLSGGTLAHQMRIMRQVPPEEGIRHVLRMAYALDAAHRHGIIHQALSPEMMTRDEQGLLYLSGFELILAGPYVPELGESVLPYRAPETFLRAPISRAADLYALGMIAYHLLAGCHPFEANTYAQWMYVHLNRQPPDLRIEQVADPEMLNAVLQATLAKQPYARPSSLLDFADALIEATYGQSRDDPFLDALVADGASDSEAIYPWVPYQISKLGVQPKPGTGNLARLYVDALMSEGENHERAIDLYRRIIELRASFAQGLVIERLYELERQERLLHLAEWEVQANQFLAQGDWVTAERLARDILASDPDHRQARLIADQAGLQMAANAHYELATLAGQTGQWSAAMMLLNELYASHPAYPDTSDLLRIHAGVAHAVHELTGVQAHNRRILGMSFSPDGRLLVSGSTDKSVRAIDVSEQRLCGTIDECFSWVSHVLFDQTGEKLYVANWDGEIRLVDVKQKRVLGVVAGLVSQVQAMAVSHHSSLLAASSGYFLTIWELPSGRRIVNQREVANQSIMSMAFLTALPWLAYGTDGGYLRVREVSTRDTRLIADIPLRFGIFRAVAVSRSGGTVVCLSRSGSAVLVDLFSQQIIESLKGHRRPLMSVAFSPDGSVIAAGGGDRILYLWQAADGTLIKKLEGHRATITYVIFSPDGRLIASADSRGQVKLWGLIG